MQVLAFIRVLMLGCTLIGCASETERDTEDATAPAERDARCVALCATEDPGPEQTRDTCNEASASRCLDRCEAQIEGVRAACANCLLEDASFSPPIVLPNVSCSPAAACGGSSECTATGETTCSYCDGDVAAAETCLRAAFPPSEVDCSPTFESDACSPSCD